MNLSMGTRREEQFRRVMAEQGVNLIRPTVTFKFLTGSYLPDWYDPAQDVFYEVIGSRQRGHQLIAKLDLMKLMHPAVVLQIVTPDGSRWQTRRENKQAQIAMLPHGQAVVRRLRADRLNTVDLIRALGVGRYDLRRQPVPAWVADRLAAFAGRTTIPLWNRPPPKSHTRPMFKHRKRCGQKCLDILELYAGGLGTPRIADLIGSHQAMVYAALRYHGVTTRPVGYFKGKARPTYPQHGAAL